MAKTSKVVELPNMTGTGVAPVRIAEIDRLAEAYVKERDKRLALTPKEVAAKAKLLEAMHSHASKLRLTDGTLVYRYDEMKITVVAGPEKLTVKSIAGEDER